MSSRGKSIHSCKLTVCQQKQRSDAVQLPTESRQQTSDTLWCWNCRQAQVTRPGKEPPSCQLLQSWTLKQGTAGLCKHSPAWPLSCYEDLHPKYPHGFLSTEPQPKHPHRLLSTETSQNLAKLRCKVHSSAQQRTGWPNSLPMKLR